MRYTMKNKGFCLASQDIRELIKKGDIKTSKDYEKRIQPSSFEPVIGDEGFIIDAEKYLFRPRDSESVYKTLLRLPKKTRIPIRSSLIRFSLVARDPGAVFDSLRVWPIRFGARLSARTLGRFFVVGLRQSHPLLAGSVR